MRKLGAVVVLIAAGVGAYVFLSRPSSPLSSTAAAPVVRKKIKIWDMRPSTETSTPAYPVKEPNPCQRNLARLVDQLGAIGADHPQMQPWSGESCENAPNYQPFLDQYEQHCRAAWHQESCKVTLTLLKARLGSELLGALEPGTIDDLSIIFTKLLAYDWRDAESILPYIHRGLELDGKNQILLLMKYAVTATDFLQHRDHLQQGWDELDAYFHEIMGSKLLVDDRVIEFHLLLELLRDADFDRDLAFVETWRDAFRSPAVYKYLKSCVFYKQKKVAEAITLLQECQVQNPEEKRCQKTLAVIKATPAGTFSQEAYSMRLDVLPVFIENLEE